MLKIKLKTYLDFSSVPIDPMRSIGTDNFFLKKKSMKGKMSAVWYQTEDVSYGQAPNRHSIIIITTLTTS